MNFNLFFKGIILLLIPVLGIAQTNLTPENALKNYISNGDMKYAWELKDSVSIGSSKAYQLLLTSQKWRNITWRHQLTVIVPATIQFDGALLFITGGSLKDEQPNWSTNDNMWPVLASVASKNKAMVALLKQVPNQPLYGGKTEDELISYTLNQFKQDKDYSWPLLFPMVKSAVKAMDAIQEFSTRQLNHKVNNFTISGASKRGWTTWLSSAIDDKRVKAIAPIVIDMLNMPKTLSYQYETYGEYSIQIEDYVKLGIPQGTDTPEGKAITAMIDPYSYREKYTIPNNKEPLVKIVTDPEYPYNVALVNYKHQTKTLTTEEGLKSKMMESLINTMLANRLTEIVQKGGAPFIFAQSNYGAFQGGLVDLDAYSSVAISKDAAGLEAALKAVIAENVRMKKFGFTDTELERAKTNMMTGMEKQFKEKDKTKSAAFVQKYVNNFLDGTAIPSIDFTYNFYKENLNGLALADINKKAAGFITEENMIAVVQAPEKEKANLPNEATLLAWIAAAGADVTPYVDNVVTKPLMAVKPKAGTVTAEKKIDAIGVTELTLSNGVKVVLKPTDFKNDQIIFSATSKGGTSLASDQDFRSAEMASQLVSGSGISEFDQTQLGKLLTGKSVGVNPYIGTYREGISGSSSPKDLETAMQLVNLYFTAPRKDPKVLQTSLEEMKTVLANRSTQPTSVFQDTVSAVLNSYKKRAESLKVEDLNQINLDKAISFYQARFANAGDFVFTFVGNFKVEEIKPLLAQYLGSLPSTGATENYKQLGLEPLNGAITKKVYKGLEDKANVTLLYHGNYNYSDKENLQLDALKAILDIKITERLREKESGVYSPGVGVNYNDEPKPNYSMGIYFSCASANVDKLIAAAEDEVNKLKQNGATAEDIQKFKAEEARQFELQLRENGFWLGTLQDAYTTGKNPVDVLNYLKTLDQVSVASTKATANQYLNNNNFKKFILLPEKK